MAISVAKNVDDYLAAVPSDAAREALESLRSAIREELPEVEEVIKYGIPTYKQNGFVASIAAFKNHCSFFPGHTADQFVEELKEFKVSKGTVQFAPDRPLPVALVKAMVRARADENAS